MTDLLAVLIGIVALVYAAVQVQRFEQGLKPYTWHVNYRIDPPNSEGRYRFANVKLYAVGSAEIPDVHVNFIGEVTINANRTPDLIGSTHGPADIDLMFLDKEPAYLVLTYGSSSLLTGRTIQQAVRLRLDAPGKPEFSHWEWGHFLGLGRRARGKWVVRKEPKRRSQWHVPSLGISPDEDPETARDVPSKES